MYYLRAIGNVPYVIQSLSELSETGCVCGRGVTRVVGFRWMISSGVIRQVEV